MTILSSWAQERKDALVRKAQVRARWKEEIKDGWVDHAFSLTVGLILLVLSGMCVGIELKITSLFTISIISLGILLITLTAAIDGEKVNYKMLWAADSIVIILYAVMRVFYE